MKTWYEAKTGNHQGLVIDENTGENIAAIYEKANARLIAAAPELLEALKLFISIYPERSRNHPDIKMAIFQAEKAIAKAEGESCE